MTSVPWPPIVEETADPERNLADALAALQEKTHGVSSAAGVLRLARAHLAEVSSIHYSAKPGFANLMKDKYYQAEMLIQDRLVESKTKRDDWGEAAMLLALAELQVEERSGVDFKLCDFDEALENALSAQAVFHSAKDPDMEAQALVVAANIHRRREVSTHCWRQGCTQTFEALDQAILLFEEAGNTAGVARARLMLGVAHAYKLEYSDALALIEESHQDFAKLGNHLYEAIALLTMAKLHLKRKRNRESGQTSRLCEEALEIFKGFGPSGPRVVEAQEAAVSACIMRGDTKEALRVAQDWVEQAEASDDLRQQCAAQVSLAMAMGLDGNWQEAMSIMSHVLSLVQDVGDPVLENELMLKASEIHILGQDAEKALKIALEAVSIAQRHQERRREAVALEVLNRVHFHNILNQNDDDEEVETYRHLAEEQRAIWLELDEIGRAATVKLNLVGMHGYEMEFERAKAAVSECLEVFVEQGDKWGEAHALRFETEIFLDLGDPSTAVKKAKEMQKCGRTIGEDTIQAQALHALSKIHYQQGRYPQAARDAVKAMATAERMRDDEAYVNYCIFVARAYLGTAVQEHEQKGLFRAKANQAENQAKIALNLARKLRSDLLQARACLCLGRVKFEQAKRDDGRQGLIENVLKYLNQAIDTFQELPAQRDEATEATILMAQVHYHCDKLERAVDAAEAAVESARRGRDGELMSEAWDLFENYQHSLAKQFPAQTMGRKFHADDLQPYSRPLQRQRPSPKEPTQPAAKEATKVQVAQSTALRQQPLDPFETKEIVVEMVRAATGATDAVHLDTPLEEAGLDSLASVSFRNGLKQRLTMNLPPDIVYDHPTTRRLVIALSSLASQ